MKRGDEMINVPKLKGKMVERGVTTEDLAKQLGIDRTTLYRKFKNNGGSFTIREANEIVSFLQLSKDDASSIFFANEVA